MKKRKFLVCVAEAIVFYHTIESNTRYTLVINMSESSKKLTKNMRKIRTRKKMSQGDICRAIDMDRGYMSAIENGKKNITIQQLERLAKALGVSVDKMLK